MQQKPSWPARYLILLGTLAGTALLGPAFVRAESRREASGPVLVVVAQAPGYSAEEVERRVTIPLEVAMSGMPRLDIIRSISLFGLSEVRLEFGRWISLTDARQEVINRLQFVNQLPADVVPLISPGTPADEVLRYVLRAPRGVYTPSDLLALQDWVLMREFRRVPAIMDAVGFGGTVKRYEVRPDPDRLAKYDVTLEQLKNVLVEANANIAGDPQNLGQLAQNVRAIGLLGGGTDPVQQAVGMKDARTAAAHLRAAEDRVLGEIRQLVIKSDERVPVRVADVVEGGPAQKGAARQGVLVGHRPPLGAVGMARKGEPDDGDVVEGIVYVRPGEDRRAALDRVKKKIEELNDRPGRLLPGVRIEPIFERPGDEKDTIWLRATFPVGSSLPQISDRMRAIRARLLERPEVKMVVSQIGRDESGTEPVGFETVRVLVRLAPEKDWPVPRGRERALSRQELLEDIQADLCRAHPGVDWNVSPDAGDDFRDAFVPAPGGHLLKIRGPDLEALQKLAERAAKELSTIDGIRDVRVRRLTGRPTLEFRVDRDKCARHGVSVTDVRLALTAALGGLPVTQIVEGDRRFDLVLRWPEALRKNEEAILAIPLVAAGAEKPRTRLRDVVSPVGAEGQPDPGGSFVRAGAGVLYREQGRRIITVAFRVSGRDGPAAVTEARRKLADLFKAPYSAEWVDAP
jgi:Cu/Ag efflux pump CusA